MAGHLLVAGTPRSSPRNAGGAPGVLRQLGLKSAKSKRPAGASWLGQRVERRDGVSIPGRVGSTRPWFLSKFGYVMGCPRRASRSENGTAYDLPSGGNF